MTRIARKEVPTAFCAVKPRKSKRGTIRNPPPRPVKDAPIPTRIPQPAIINSVAFIVLCRGGLQVYLQPLLLQVFFDRLNAKGAIVKNRSGQQDLCATLNNRLVEVFQCAGTAGSYNREIHNV